MREYLADRLLNGPRAYERRIINYDEFLTGPEIKATPLLINGQMALSDPKKRIKMLDKTAWPFYDAEIARQYLAHIVKEQSSRKHVGFSNKSRAMLRVAPPRYFAGPVLAGNFAYLDMRKAYFQLYETATLDLEFDPARMRLARGQVDFLSPGWLSKESVIRRCVTGIATSQSMPTIRYGRGGLERNYNRFLAPGLWGYMMFCLHHMAREVVARHGALYWNTDGFIVPEDAAEAARLYLLTEWGAAFGVKGRGPGRVWGSASYQVGELKTLSNTPTRRLSNLLAYDPKMAARLKYWRYWLACKAM